ncbi:camphor resistance protein CrcB [Quadrisphaera granulorum]|uniref:Fluoride-specific ion channel FluC n=1 Tax=Quadrisphaera granulorum TaxID=317664 RepID=A0A316AEN3_9ACTN|nr:CrcB family protein [Quadrisphaera granulorum]PWJ55440.1 camphor resistance protein CrcB [Quadrisphaera granulorum]SZE95504.1 camphor resistance protein CrcB [Quadrisphaera granulorum]
MNGTALLLVVLGGIVGAPARFLVDGAITSRLRRRASPAAQGPSAVVPPGTLVVNLLGAFVLGVLAGLAPPGASTSQGPLWLVAGATGFCGSFTTFSSAVLEAVRLAQAGRWGAAATTTAAHLIGSLAALAAGLTAGLALG